MSKENYLKDYKKVWLLGHKISRNEGWIKTFGQYCIGHRSAPAPSTTTWHIVFIDF